MYIQKTHSKNELLRLSTIRLLSGVETTRLFPVIASAWLLSVVETTELAIPTTLISTAPVIAMTRNEEEATELASSTKLIRNQSGLQHTLT